MKPASPLDGAVSATTASRPRLPEGFVVVGWLLSGYSQALNPLLVEEVASSWCWDDSRQKLRARPLGPRFKVPGQADETGVERSGRGPALAAARAPAGLAHGQLAARGEAGIGAHLSASLVTGIRLCLVAVASQQHPGLARIKRVLNAAVLPVSRPTIRRSFPPAAWVKECWLRFFAVGNHHNGDRGILSLARMAAVIAPIGALVLSIALLWPTVVLTRRQAARFPSPHSGVPQRRLANDENTATSRPARSNTQGQTGGR